MSPKHVLVTTLATALLGACSQMPTTSPVKDTVGNPQLPPEGTYVCSADGAQTSGLGVAVDQSLVDHSFYAQIVTWTGGGNYSATAPATQVTASLASSGLDLRAATFEVVIAQQANSDGLYSAQLFMGKVQQALLCVQLSPPVTMNPSGTSTGPDAPPALIP